MRHSTALVGCGYWGNNHRKVLTAKKDVNLKYICDPAINRRLETGAKVVRDYKIALGDSSIDSIVVATPTETHYKIVSDCLNAGKHVLVEKPITMNSREAEKLVKLARDKDRRLMVGHIFMHHPAIQYLKKSIDSGDLGDILYMDARWLGYGIVREKENVLWDLAPHNLSLFSYLSKTKPVSVNSFGSSLKGISEKQEDLVQVNLKFDGGSPVGCLSVSWIHPKKVRELTVVGNRGMAIFDDMSPEKLTFYDIDTTGLDNVSPEKYVMYGKIGASSSPSLEGISPLEAQCNNFFESIESSTNPLSDGENGVEVMKLLEHAQESMRKSGKEVFIR